MLEPPDKKIAIYLILMMVIISVIAFVIGYFIGTSSHESEQAEISYNDLFLRAPNTPPTFDIRVYGVKIDLTLHKIIKCESGFEEKVCNKKYGCGAGMGLAQLTPIAIKDCENHLHKKINPFNGKENLECSLWLYKTYGTKPWGTAKTDWGSYNCWQE